MVMGKKKIFVPNCRREEIDGVNFVVCSPEIIEDNIRVPQGKVIFKEVSEDTLELIKEERLSEEATLKTKEYLESLGLKVKL